MINCFVRSTNFMYSLFVVAPVSTITRASDNQGFWSHRTGREGTVCFLLFLRFRFALLAVAVASFHIQVCIPKFTIFHESQVRFDTIEVVLKGQGLLLGAILGVLGRLRVSVLGVLGQPWTPLSHDRRQRPLRRSALDHLKGIPKGSPNGSEMV